MGYTGENMVKSFLLTQARIGRIKIHTFCKSEGTNTLSKVALTR